MVLEVAKRENMDFQALPVGSLQPYPRPVKSNELEQNFLPHLDTYTLI